MPTQKGGISPVESTDIHSGKTIGVTNNIIDGYLSLGVSVRHVSEPADTTPAT